MKYTLVTFGCRVNQSDSLALETELHACGAEPSPSAEADFVIVNTCSVTATADQGARQTIRRIARENPRARIVATGCYASRCSSEVAALPGVAAVISNAAKAPALFFREAQEALGTRGSLLPPTSLGSLGGEPGGSSAVNEGPCGRPLAPGLMGRTSWTLRVQTGCNEACSYCIIPRTRGASASRALEDVQEELSRVRAAGYREVVVTGVHLGSYGRDLAPRRSLAELMTTLATADLDARPAVAAAGGRGIDLAADPLLFRISSLEPMDFPLELLDLVAGQLDAGTAWRGGVAPHFHLPLQHASDRMLQAMHRPYTGEAYAALVHTIRQRLPHAAIGTDVIVGFPGETEEDFEQLASYLEGSPLTHLHVFPYSDRPGTVASALPGKVHGAVVKARALRLREISRRLADRFRAAQRGTTRPALTIDDGSVAVTDNYFRVPAPPGRGRNQWVAVTL